MPDESASNQTEVSSVIGKIDRDFVEQQAGKITDKDIEIAFERADDIEHMFASSGPLRRFVTDVKLLIALVKDYWRGTYREIPYLTLGAIVFTLLYALNPLDLIPDVVPVLGQLDDAAVVSVCLLFIEQDLHAYRKWKQNAKNN